MRILFLLIPVVMILIACDKDDDMSVGNSYPYHFEFQEIQMGSKIAVEMLSETDFSVIEESDYNEKINYIFSDTTQFYQYALMSNEILTVEDIYIINQNELRIVNDRDSFIIDTTVNYTWLDNKYIVVDGDTLPFIFDGEEIDFCSKVDIVIAGPLSQAREGFTFDNCLDSDHDLREDVEMVIDREDVIQDDTIAVYLFEFLYQRR